MQNIMEEKKYSGGGDAVFIGTGEPFSWFVSSVTPNEWKRNKRVKIVAMVRQYE